MNAADLFAELGITQCPMTRYRRPGMPWTHCGAVVDKMIREHGAPHARQVLMLFVETKGNAGMMVRPMIEAVSDILLLHQRWRDAGSALLHIFDQISMSTIWEKAKATRIKARREIISALLFVELEKILGPSRPAKRPARTKAEVVTHYLALGVALLKSKQEEPERSTVLVHELHKVDPKGATAQRAMAVARLYADNWEITDKVSWESLVELSRSPPDLRRKFETAILGGQKVFGQQIRTARQARARRTGDPRDSASPMREAV
jgi:hypothetical protein